MLGCVKKEAGSTLYLYDSGSNAVVVWEDVDKVYEAAREGKPVPAADRTIEYKEFKNMTLAWGGLTVDPSNDRLYLVSDQGRVFVIPNAKDRNGTLTGKSQVTSFNLGESGSEKFTNGSVFGPASVDPNQDILYVMENDKGGEAARIWHIAKASKVAHNATLGFKERGVPQQDSDQLGAGVVAAPDGKFYGLFGGGKGIARLGHDEDAMGPRLRQGKSRGQRGEFQTAAHLLSINILIGPKTKLTHAFKYGSLAYDGQHHELYAFTEPQKDPEILVFGEGQFHGGHNLDQGPTRVLGGAPRDLRILTLPQNSQWLLGARFSPAPGTGYNGPGDGQGILEIWKNPSEGDRDHLTVKQLPGISRIRGIAVGGQD
jgi:hypothetical protein